MRGMAAVFCFSYKIAKNPEEMRGKFSEKPLTIEKRGGIMLKLSVMCGNGAIGAAYS
jgi:hypothetical protein